MAELKTLDLSHYEVGGADDEWAESLTEPTSIVSIRLGP